MMPCTVSHCLKNAALLRRSPTRETYKIFRADPKLIAGANIKIKLPKQSHNEIKPTVPEDL